MKKILYSLFVAVAAMVCPACSSDNGSGDEPTPVFQIIEKTLSATADGAETIVSFDAPSAWTASSSAVWAQVTPQKGNAGSSSITVTASKNESQDAREATVTVTSDRSKKLVVVTVKQEGSQNVAEPEDIDAAAFIAGITVGWNLGNTCEGEPNEDSWGNPKATPELIAAVRAAGFNTIRIPVRWAPHADDNLNIKQEWLNRVKEIVDYAYAQNMYVIINSHHDTWYDRLTPNYNAADIKTKFGNMWNQIATAFKGYDGHLAFAGFNEIVTKDANGNENWGAPTTAVQDFMNELQQIFVDRVRATGGNNAKRPLIITSYACNFDLVANSSFKMPTDQVEGRLIYEYHQYQWTYSTEQAGSENKYFWGEPYKSYKPWFANGESELDWRCGEVKKKFIDKGIPVLLGEFGCVQHNKSGNDEVADESRGYYHKMVVSKAKAAGIAPIYWDNGQFTGTGENFGLFDRKNGNKVPPRAQVALDGIMAGLE